MQEHKEPQRIVRSRSERVIAGVAGGLATALHIDPLIIRIVFLILSPLNGMGLVLYIVLWALMPNEDSTTADTRSHVQENINEMQRTIQQGVMWVQSLFQRK